MTSCSPGWRAPWCSPPSRWHQATVRRRVEAAYALSSLTVALALALVLFLRSGAARHLRLRSPERRCSDPSHTGRRRMTATVTAVCSPTAPSHGWRMPYAPCSAPRRRRRRCRGRQRLHLRRDRPDQGTDRGTGQSRRTPTPGTRAAATVARPRQPGSTSPSSTRTRSSRRMRCRSWRRWPPSQAWASRWAPSGSPTRPK